MTTVAVAIMLAACGDDATNKPSDEPAAPSSIASVSPSPAPFDGEVSLEVFGPECQRVACWLPVQFEPSLVERETVSLYDQWPMSGDTVRVLCFAKGDIYLNHLGHPVKDWYGILVPQDKLEPAAATDPRLEKIERGYRGYVGVSWIQDGEGHQAPRC